ncbi:MAG: hypothetical protein ACR2JB_14985 [Bryobacteraceae bacterium]
MNLLWPDNAALPAEFRPDVQIGVMVIKGKALYVPKGAKQSVDFTVIPYDA